MDITDISNFIDSIKDDSDIKEDLYYINKFNLADQKSQKKIDINKDKYYYDDLEALYNFVIIWSNMNSNNPNNANNDIVHVHVLENDILINKNVPLDDFINILSKINFKFISRGNNKIYYIDLIKLFESNNLIKYDPYDVTLSLIAIALYLNVWDICYPNTNNIKFNNGMVKTIMTYIKYTPYGEDLIIHE